MMITKPLSSMILGLAVLTACGGGQDDPGDGERELARAMCADLDDGASMFQMHAQAVEHYRSLADGRNEDAVQLAAAELEDLATSEFCPEHRAVFEETVMFTDWIEPQQ